MQNNKIENKSNNNIELSSDEINNTNKKKLIIKLILFWIFIILLFSTIIYFGEFFLIPQRNCNGSINCLNDMNKSLALLIIDIFITSIIGYFCYKKIKKSSKVDKKIFRQCILLSFIIFVFIISILPIIISYIINV